MRHRLRFVTTVILVVSGSLTLFVASGAFTLDLFVIISFMGYLATIELTATNAIVLPWRRRLHRLTVVGLIGASLLLGRLVVEILPDQGYL